MLESKLERVRIDALRPYENNARTHSKRQISQIAASIKRFGFTNPVLVDDNLMIIAGHGRVEAAKQLALEEAPVLRLSHLSEDEKRAYIIADNRLAEKAGWDKEILAIELQALVDIDFDLDAIGFETPEIDHVIGAAAEANASARDAAADSVSAPAAVAVSRMGDVWMLGRHRLLCGDARNHADYALLLGEERAQVMFTDPPYNVPIDGFVGGSGKIKHRTFAMAAGEMSSAEFEEFLASTLGAAVTHMSDGAIAFVCMDWRHMQELLSAGAKAFHELKNLCVWTKSNGGMGSLYRSQHELVFVYKHGDAGNVNNVELGRHGRNRTNVWSYAGINAFGATRDDELAMHPTVKPVALIEDAVKDVSRRGDLVLDPFGGSGSTLIAAERCGRSARLLEIDPLYCDVIVRRFEEFTGKTAMHQSGETFEVLSATRAEVK